MKTTFILGASALLMFNLAAAQPHGGHHHRHHRRDVVTEYATVTQAPVHVIVYVDHNGVPVSTRTVTSGVESPTPVADSVTSPTYGKPATPTPHVPSPASSSPSPPPPPPQSPAQQSSAAPPPPKSPAAESSASSPPPPPPSPSPVEKPTAPPQPPKAETSASPPAPAPSPDGQAPPPASGGHGITYTPYTDGGLCKTHGEVAADFRKIDGFSLLRLYGTDCNQLDTVVPQARAKGMRLFLGIANANVTANRIDDEVATFARYFGNGGWGIVDTISVGNEPVNSGMPLGTVLAAVDKARAGLRARGYGGPVVVADTFVAMKAHPEICQRSDYAATNLHAFFDGNVEAARAGAFVAEQALQVKQACGGKRVVVTETGWPTQGGTNRKAVPSHENQQAAVSSIKRECGAKQVPVIFFAAFNELWKKDHAATHGCEKFWGMLG